MTDRFKEALEALDESNNWSEWVHDHEDTIRAALTAAAWQDISTAPRDGTSILVSGIDDIVSMVTYADWKPGWNNGDYTYDLDDFTHWQPLPTPPTAEKGRRDE